MNCERCGGLMVEHLMYGEHNRIDGYRCVACGDVIDTVILNNKKYGIVYDPEDEVMRRVPIQ